MTVFSSVVEKIGPLLDAFDGLLSLARKFQGFLSFAAFLVLAGFLGLNSMFSEGSFDLILANFGEMTPTHFYNVVLIFMLSTFMLLTLLVLLGFVDISRREIGVIAEPVSEEVPPPADDTPDLGFMDILEDTLPSPEPGSLPGLLPILDPRPTPQPQDALPAERVFISYAERDYARALKLAKFLRSKHYYVWNLEDAVPYARLDVATEQAILRSDMVVSLLSNSFAETLRVRVEAEFARDNRKPVIAVLTEVPNDILARRFPARSRLTMYADWAQEADALHARLLEVSAKGLKAPEIDDTSPEPVIDPDILEKLPLPREEQPVPSVSSETVPVPPVKKPVTKTVTKTTRHTNPFIYGVAVRPELFVGRHEVLNRITGRLGLELQSVSVVADRRMGKTSLLRYITSRASMLLPRENDQVAVYINMQDARAKDPEGIMRLLRRRVQRQAGCELWPERADGDLTVMAESFEELAERGTQMVLCLDEWENVMAYPELNDVIEQFRASGAVSQIGMVVATAHELSALTHAGGITSPFYNIFETAYMGLLPRKEWVGLVRLAFARSGLEVRDDELALIEDLAGGHPSLTQMAGSMVWQARSEGWRPADVRARYLRPASSILTSTWARLTEMERAAVRESLGILSDERAPLEVWDALKRRGVLTADDTVFCKPFADLVLAEEL